MAGKSGVAGRVGWVVLAAGGPMVGLGVWWPSVVANPVSAIMLSLGYLVLVAVCRFAVDVVADLRKRWRDRIVDEMDRALRRRLSRFRWRYRSVTLAALRTVDLKGLPTVGYYTPELDEVFVDVSLVHRPPGQVPGGLLWDEPIELSDRLWLGDLINRSEPAVLAVIGAPGSGKTTLLRHAARQMCRSHWRRRRRVPTLLYLRDHAATIVAEPQVSLPELMRKQVRQFGIEEPNGWFEWQLRKGRCVVLLDGLDEVAERDDRRAVAGWVERQLIRYPYNDFVITSRPHGYRDARIETATVLQVRSFTDEQVTTFIRAWYRAVERRATSLPGDSRSRAASRSADLLDRLRRSTELYELTVNPLLLTMIANVHRELGALPGSRADLFAEVCQVALGGRQDAKNLPSHLDAGTKEVVLRRTAFIMMQQGVRELPAEEVLADITRSLRRVTSNQTAEAFLADVAANGVLIEREPSTYAFAHMTLQEFLAAAHIRAEGMSDVLVNNVDNA